MSGVCENTESRGGVDDILFEKLVTRENLFRAWQTFSRGKWRQRAVCRFWLHLEKELNALYHDLKDGIYTHGPYFHFVVRDTKRRDIYVARVRDRVVHQLLSSYLEERFGSHFIAQSFAAQKGKGVHAARAYVLCIMRRLQRYGARVWVGKLDVEKYFSNIDHEILIALLRRRILDEKILALYQKIIASFGYNGHGLPLGNLTSQWFSNIYLHELDWYAKHGLRVRHYMRYNDDMIVVDTDERRLREQVRALRLFAQQRLKLNIPEAKTSIVQLKATVDVLGICTNGERTWVRQTTATKAAYTLACRYTEQTPTLLDTMCAYYGNRITYELQEAIT